MVGLAGQMIGLVAAHLIWQTMHMREFSSGEPGANAWFVGARGMKDDEYDMANDTSDRTNCSRDITTERHA